MKFRTGGGGKKNDQKLIFKKNQRRALVRGVEPSNGSALKMKSVTFSRAFITRRAFTDSGQDEQIFAAKRVSAVLVQTSSPPPARTVVTKSERDAAVQIFFTPFTFSIDTHFDSYKNEIRRALFFKRYVKTNIDYCRPVNRNSQ